MTMQYSSIAALILTVALLAGKPCFAGEMTPKPVVVKSIVLDGQKIAPGGAVAEIIGLRKDGDGFLSVRAAPSIKAAEIDRLDQGARVILATPDDWDAATFVGIIYAPAVRDDVPLMETCQIPEAPPYFDGPYTGPCRSGWVAKRFVQVLAD